MNDLDAIIEVTDDVLNVRNLDDETLSHAYDLCIELIDIFDDEMFRRGLTAKVGSK